MSLSHHRGGTGEPLLLLHGIGSQWQMWEPVLPALEAEHDVLAVDMPGFGGSPLLPPGTTPDPEGLADALEAWLDGLGVGRAHVAGNSLGGWVALELAKRGRTLSACALSPAGFWTTAEQRYATISLRVSHAAATAIGPRAETLLASPRVRKASNAQLMAHADRLTPQEAAGALQNLAASPGWKVTLDAMGKRTFTGGADVRGPVTIAWGQKDRLLVPRQAERARAQLPQARHIWLTDCGHVPTWDGPEVVTQAILSSR